jgi:hypothetical protein
MYINFEFHSAPERVQVFFNHHNLEDEALRFRLGVSKTRDHHHIAYWRSNESASERLTHLQLMQISLEHPLRLERGDTVRVEKEGCSETEAGTTCWDTGKVWPLNQDGASITEIRRCF